MKLTMILLLLITSLMAVIAAFLTTSVSSFYIDTFYQQIDAVFGEENDDFYITHVTYHIDEYGNEWNELTLTKWLKIERETSNVM